MAGSEATCLWNGGGYMQRRCPEEVLPEEGPGAACGGRGACGTSRQQDRVASHPGALTGSSSAAQPGLGNA